MRYEWTSAGVKWGCDAYDHGPFCRLCVNLDAKAKTFTDYDAQRAKASEIVAAVWRDLMDRQGFDVDDAEMEQEIKDDLTRIVRRLL